MAGAIQRERQLVLEHRAKMRKLRKEGKVMEYEI